MIADLKAKFEGFDRKRLYTALAALIVAGAAGHFVQRGAIRVDPSTNALSASVPPRTAVPAPASGQDNTSASFVPQPGAVVESPIPLAPSVAASEISAGLDMPPNIAATVGPEDEVARASSEPLQSLIAPIPEANYAPETEIAVAALEDAKAVEPSPLVEPLAEAMPSCPVSVAATPMPGALVLLSVEAPCLSGQDIDIEHAGLHFSEMLGPDGGLTLLAPAMTEEAVFQVSFADGTARPATTKVPDMANFERIALVWRGPTGLQIHAFEGGASYGQPGHVWAEDPATPERAAEGQGGFVSVLGSTSGGFAADVYTYPVSLVEAGAEPEITIEAEVLENTCGKRIEGTVLRSKPGFPPTIEPLSLAMPGCDAVGEYLVLKNLPQELKIAAN